MRHRKRAAHPACQEAAAYQGPRRLRFTLIPGEDILRFEVFYSGEAPQEKPSFRLKGARFSDLLAWLFDDTPRGTTPCGAWRTPPSW